MNIDLVKGDSMVKNIDSIKLERAAKKKAVHHSYSGATVEQIHQKIWEYCNEDHNYQRAAIHVGTYDLAREKPDQVAKKIEELITELKTHANEVAASSVIRRYDNKVRASNITHYIILLP
jgi:predicted translin family RNA/ssDNA-binding protein